MEYDSYGKRQNFEKIVGQNNDGIHSNTIGYIYGGKSQCNTPSMQQGQKFVYNEVNSYMKNTAGNLNACISGSQANFDETYSTHSKESNSKKGRIIISRNPLDMREKQDKKAMTLKKLGQDGENLLEGALNMNFPSG